MGGRWGTIADFHSKGVEDSVAVNFLSGAILVYDVPKALNFEVIIPSLLHESFFVIKYNVLEEMIFRQTNFLGLISYVYQYITFVYSFPRSFISRRVFFLFSPISNILDAVRKFGEEF